MADDDAGDGKVQGKASRMAGKLLKRPRAIGQPAYSMRSPTALLTTKQMAKIIR